MHRKSLEVDCIHEGDCIEILRALPEESIDLIFADPPYNLQLNQELWRPNQTKVEGVDDDWDKFTNFQSYDEFSLAWLNECRRVLKTDGAIWVIGTYHNIFRIGSIMQDLEFWFLNDVIWIKTNPMPNFRGVRYTNAHETLIWACKQKKGKYTFNYHAMKAINEGLQMRSDWKIPVCTGRERIKVNGKKAHSTQKPEALLYRVIVSSSNSGDIVLDPFFGTGTTGAVAKKLHRHWIGIENNSQYVKIAQERIDHIHQKSPDPSVFDVSDKKRNQRRIPFSDLLGSGIVHPGQPLYFDADRKNKAVIQADSNLLIQGFSGSIHQTAKYLSDGKPSNGWDRWYYENENSVLKQIDELRSVYLIELNSDEGE
jgi:modification methylase